jgi:hypothetical protein
MFNRKWVFSAFFAIGGCAFVTKTWPFFSSDKLRVCIKIGLVLNTRNMGCSETCTFKKINEMREWKKMKE